MQEDITFNFNSGGTKHPNSLHAWMPREDQEDEYPGASSSNHDDHYSMGFFAGITVETDDVIIDLNGFEIAMDEKFYIQQRFFVCISLTNKLFNDNQGPSFMGIGQKSVNNVVIKNGIIGLTSHMGIFGINSHNVHLINLVVRDFETHGIALDKFEGFTIKNVEIGPSVNGQLKVNKRYTTARLMLPVFYAVANENPDTEISFYQRGSYTMQDIIDQLLKRMDLAFEYAVNGLTNIDTESDLWKETRELFINQHGVSTHTSIYGLVLRPKKGGYSEYDEYDENEIDSRHAIIDKLYIHDLIVNHEQVTKIGVSQDIWLRNSFNSPIDLSCAVRKVKHTEEWMHDEDYYEPGPLPHIEDAVYYGDVYTDALIAIRQLSSSCWSLGRTVIWPQIIEWAQNGNTLKEYLNPDDDKPLEIKQICGYDMVSGESQGVIGIKIAYSRDVRMSNVRIDNLINMGEFGNVDCDYYGRDYNGNRAAAISIYKGTNVNIAELDVSNIVSFTGPAFGVYIDKDADTDDNDIDDENNDVVSMNVRGHRKYRAGKVSVRKLIENDEETETETAQEYQFIFNYATFSHIDAGVKATYDHIDMSRDVGINKAAISCSLFCEGDCKDVDHYDIEQQCINGHIGCPDEYNQMLIHHECQVDAEYTTPIGTVHVKSNGEINAHFITAPEDPGYTSIIIKGWYFAVGIVAILAILAAIKYVYFRHSKDKTEQQRNDDLMAQQAQDEDLPLIRDRSNREQDNGYNTL